MVSGCQPLQIVTEKATDEVWATPIFAPEKLMEDENTAMGAPVQASVKDSGDGTDEVDIAALVGG